MPNKTIRSIRTSILVGFFLAAPIVTTILIFRFLVRLATAWLPASAFPRLAAIGGGYLLRALTLLVVLLALFGIGLLARRFFGVRLIRLGDSLLSRIPIIRTIYITLRQLSDSLFTQRDTFFKEVVLVEYPRQGVYSIGFVTAQAAAVIGEAVTSRGGPDEPMVNIFIATTPNPTSGIFIIVPQSQIIPLRVTVADAMSMVMSAGAILPVNADGKHPDFIEKIHTWLQGQD